MGQTTKTGLRHALATALLCGSTIAASGALAADTGAAGAPCPQPRSTERAPDSYQQRANPLPASAEHLQRGRRLYESLARPADCASCHGKRGDGKGPAAQGLLPPPRDFRCAATMQALSDGQLYWVIENGSGPFHLPARQGAQQIERPGRGAPSTAMRGYGDQLSETDIWQLVLYLRSFSSQP